MLAPKSSRESRESPTFAELGVAVEICDALADNGITHTFAIQELTLPIALNGQDLIGQARTGMGKTYGFGVPLLDRVFDDADIPELDGTPRALVIAPTRELAIQVSGDLELAAANLPLRVVTLCGGRPYEEQIKEIESGADVVVGTPGRLLDLCQKKHLSFDHVSVLVLDEADEMLDLGFLPDIEKILSLLHGNPHQTMLFSATMPGPIVTLARTFLEKPVHIRAESGDAQQTHASTRKVTFQAHRMDKIAVLGKVLQAEGRGRTIIFTRTKRSAAAVADELAQRGFRVGAVHGDLDQKARERSLDAFRKGTVEILVATDVAARGIDIDDVTHVINYQVPDDPMTFVHRIGRTGRAGHTGTAITLVGYDELGKWQVINDELDLGQPEPPQWFSTSPELAEALDIPKTVADTVGPPTKVLGAPRRSHSRGESPRGGSPRSSTASARASRRTRSRTRKPRQGGRR
ncbi:MULTISPECIES: DEAD/DEAH box helicase [Corynebacterium]|uniref:DEAD/DEAH box helicase n=1 Tax=Corynebacterium TaxID=1716 RepID=UPI0008A52A93|nr:MULTISPECIES: DEAD/DEAH box helicase [Corynebacterium]OFS36438.1 DEAD/DEAH box helicase [Corynebacterium sp. HMSC069E04]QQU95450.1 DEAD/DEAH box helicase [Corynebacterium aurimucosum]UTA71648.1 DEAD/DEAH box helicase [Corynebacterium aurimucosum]WJY69881.1 DEAD-box ATP-dependent RNA helicase CshA [Corynebacterium aurimucosum]